MVRAHDFPSLPSSLPSSSLCSDMLDIVWYCLWSFGAWREEVSSEKVLESKQHFATFLSLERFRNATVMDVLGRPGFGQTQQSRELESRPGKHTHTHTRSATQAGGGGGGEAGGSTHRA